MYISYKRTPDMSRPLPLGNNIEAIGLPVSARYMGFWVARSAQLLVRSTSSCPLDTR